VSTLEGFLVKADLGTTNAQRDVDEIARAVKDALGLEVFLGRSIDGAFNGMTLWELYQIRWPGRPVDPQIAQAWVESAGCSAKYFALDSCVLIDRATEPDDRLRVIKLVYQLLTQKFGDVFVVRFWLDNRENETDLVISETPLALNSYEDWEKMSLKVAYRLVQ
jgi:hypothetical protein